MRFKKWLSEGMSDQQIAAEFRKLGYLTSDATGGQEWISRIKNSVLDATGLTANFTGSFDNPTTWSPPIGMNTVSILRLNSFHLTAEGISKLPKVVQDRAEILYCTYDGALVQWAIHACRDVRFESTLLTFEDFGVLLGSNLRQWVYSTVDLIINRSGDVIIAEYPDEEYRHSLQEKFNDEFEFQEWLIDNEWFDRVDCFKRG
ncbi:hypothetical protein RsoM2USA_275 [Ralstonia phage RsoM2USA]|nr:hypothetical protein RsoM2USA_275 [Ralstonia phage RsoM2USA]